MARKQAQSRSKFTAAPAVTVVEDDEDDLDLETAETITDNAFIVPLFADIDGRTSRSISKLRVYKLEGGGMAYKGNVPTTSTLDTIGQVYGDGIYTIEGLNHRDSVLYTKDNLRISLTSVNGNPSSEVQASTSSADLDRVERLARLSANETMSNNQTFLQLMITTMQHQSDLQAERERAASERDRQFYASLMTMQERNSANTLLILAQTLQVERARGERDDRGDSQTAVQTLLQGLRLGREMSQSEESDEDPQPPWVGLLQGGLNALGQVAQTRGPLATATTQPNAKRTQKRVLTTAHKRALREAVALYKAVRDKGIEPAELIAGLSNVEVARPPAPTLASAMTAEREPPEETESEDDSDDDILDEDSEDDELDVDGDESDADESEESAGSSHADSAAYP